MSRPLFKSTYYYKLNRRIPNGTYGGVRGKSIHYSVKSFLYSIVIFNYVNTSSILEYGIALNERNMGFCTNKITGRYSMQGYYSKLECEEL